MFLLQEIEGSRYKLLLGQDDYGYYTPYTDSTVKGDLYPAYLFNLTADPVESENLLEADMDRKIISVIKTLVSNLCLYYSTAMIGALYRGDESKAGYIFDDNDGFVTHWQPYPNFTSSDGNGIRNAPPCDQDTLVLYLTTLQS